MLLNNLTDQCSESREQGERNLEGSGAGYLKDLAFAHPCAKHALFTRLNNAGQNPISGKQAIGLLVNYDAHAGLLRRLLLKAAAFMPEAAVGFVLENVRNEYGNGDYSMCHQGQLHDVIAQVRKLTKLEELEQPSLRKGVKRYIRQVVDYYHPHGYHVDLNSGMYGPAITAGAITATELMALEEFKAMQVAFRKFGLDYHPWFDHVNVECDHGEESLALAEHFIEKYDAAASVEYGFNKTLEANVHLYDGLLEAIEAGEEENAAFLGNRVNGADEK